MMIMTTWSHFSKLEVDNLNLQLKYQHLEERIKITNAKISSDAPEFDAYLKSNKSDVIESQKPQSADSQSFQLQNMINKLKHDNDCFQAENSKVKQHYKELYDSIKITREKINEK